MDVRSDSSTPSSSSSSSNDVLCSETVERLQLQRSIGAAASVGTATTPADCAFKLVVVGNANVGKSSLLKRLAYREYTMSGAKPTIVVDLLQAQYTVQRDQRSVSVLLWDTAGSERFRSNIRAFYRGAHAVLAVFDLTDAESFDALDTWIGEAQADAATAQVLVVGNKCDLSERRQVRTSRAQEFCNERHFFYAETSAQTGHNVEPLFAHVVGTLYEQECVVAATTRDAGSAEARANALRVGKPVTLHDPTTTATTTTNSAPARGSACSC